MQVTELKPTIAFISTSEWQYSVKITRQPLQTSIMFTFHDSIYSRLPFLEEDEHDSVACIINISNIWGMFCAKTFFTITAKFLRVHWLIFIVSQSTDNKNDIRCSTRAFSSESKANSALNLSLFILLKTNRRQFFMRLSCY